MSQWELRLRLLAVRIAILGTFLLLAARLWQLQIVRGQEFQERANQNRFRVETIDAPRGVFYDRNRQLLVNNVPRYTVSLIASRLPETAAERQPILERLSSVLGIPVSSSVSPPVASLRDMPSSAVSTSASLEEMVQQAEERPYDPYPIATNVDRQLAFILLEELPRLPGVTVEIQPMRQYLDGPLFSHILGYLWRMPKEDVEHYTNLPNSDYTPNDMVGYAGLERTMETELHGRRGRRQVEVDAFGREVALLNVEPAQPGHSLVLTLDRDLQAHTEQYLRQGMAAANGKSAVAIVMNPNTGEVLSMVSLPSYDNNIFAQGKIESYADLARDPSQPMFNRAIAGQYPPGSTFKLIPASAGLQEKVINRNTTLHCGGVLYLDSMGSKWPFYCWIYPYGSQHGDINVVSALAQSCDIFFYQLAGGYGDFAGLGLETLTRYARLFGLGQPTGIELSGEASGLVPSADWKRQNYHESWTTGDTYNAGIGQGFDLVTPLQMANVVSVVANGGTLYRPQLIREIIDADGRVVRPFQPQVIRKLDLSPGTLATVREGMRLAVTGGTASSAGLPEIAVAGKTGSAEFGEPNAKGQRPTHAWFVGFAPYDKPEVAVMIFIEGGGEGSSKAAPVAAQILRYYFGLPTPQTSGTK